MPQLAPLIYLSLGGQFEADGKGSICPIIPIWHGMFAIPNWVVSWFTDDVYCKAPNSTTAYSVWWWISFVLAGLGIIGGGNNRR